MATHTGLARSPSKSLTEQIQTDKIARGSEIHSYPRTPPSSFGQVRLSPEKMLALSVTSRVTVVRSWFQTLATPTSGAPPPSSPRRGLEEGKCLASGNQILREAHTETRAFRVLGHTSGWRGRREQRSRQSPQCQLVGIAGIPLLFPSRGTHSTAENLLGLKQHMLSRQPWGTQGGHSGRTHSRDRERCKQHSPSRRWSRPSLEPRP